MSEKLGSRLPATPSQGHIEVIEEALRRDLGSSSSTGSGPATIFPKPRRSNLPSRPSTHVGGAALIPPRACRPRPQRSDLRAPVAVRHSRACATRRGWTARPN